MIYYSFYLCIYLLDLQESAEVLLHRKSNYPDLLLKMPRFVSSVVEWLKRRAGDHYGHDSKPTRAILLCS